MKNEWRGVRLPLQWISGRMSRNSEMGSIEVGEAYGQRRKTGGEVSEALRVHFSHYIFMLREY
jgi:hypothetical protein